MEDTTVSLKGMEMDATDPAVAELLDRLLLGVLSRAASIARSSVPSGREELQAAVALGRFYAEQGYSVAGLFRTIQRVGERSTWLAPPVAQPWPQPVQVWHDALATVLQEVCAVALLAYEREQRRRQRTELQAAQDIAVRHTALAIVDMLVQSLSLVYGYAELLENWADLDEDVRRLVREIYSGAARLNADLDRVRRLCRYVTRSYGQELEVLDIERAAAAEPAAPQA